MFPKSPKHAEQIEILAVCEKSVATRWRMQQNVNGSDEIEVPLVLVTWHGHQATKCSVIA